MSSSITACATAVAEDVDFEPGDAQAAGFSPERLARIEKVFDRDVQRGAIPGAVILIARHGKVVYSGVFGYRDPVTRSTMTLDAQFRLASMTKPVVSVAAMLLVEEGRMQLTDAVSMYLPELKERRVETDGAENSSVAAHEMTIHDLMRHTSGLTYGEFGTSNVHKKYVHADLLNPAQSSSEFLHKLASLPLLHQPGTTFEYGLSTDVLGCLVEKVSGLGLDRFIAERIAQPLGLKSFSFQISASDAMSLARPLPGAGEEALNALNSELRPQAWMSGGGGLNGNARDYLRFAQTLLNGGTLEGVRLLSPKTVALMLSDALPPDVGYGEYVDALGFMAPTAAFGQGFGLGLTVRTVAGRNPLPGSPGDASWAGRWGTYFWIDPLEGLACVLLMQASPERARYRALARTLVYQALLA